MAKKAESQAEQEIPGMNLNNNYSEKKPIMPENSSQIQKEMEKTKKELEKLKGAIVKKYPFIQAISILPPQTVKKFIEDELGENVPQPELEKLMKKIHLYIIIPESQFKNIPKIKKDIIEIAEKSKQSVWIYLKTPVDIWEAGLDSKFDLVEGIGMSFPLYDNRGLLEGLRVASIHKSLVLQKFEKYVVSYVIAGSMVRSENTKTSDVDVFVIINDTDVKRMPRLELKERLRSIIFQYIAEANALAGVKKNILNVQIYLLTDFWEAVKDAHPIMFTFIRDGIPLYDRGTFLPWKALLKMGKLKPSPEALDMFMSIGDKGVKRAKAAMLDILIHDIFQSVNLPSQGLLMLYGLPPPTIQETVKEMKRIFVDKEKMLELKYIKMLEEITIKYYKGYEHEKIKEITGAQLDKLLKNTDDYLKRLKELRKQIEKRSSEKTIEQVFKDTMELMKAVTGKTSYSEIEKEFEKKFIKTGKFPQSHLKIFKEVLSARTEFKKGKLDIHKVDNARKDAATLINDLMEFTQRCELITLEKGRMILKYKVAGKNQVAELLSCNGLTFLFLPGNVIKKATNKKFEMSNMKEVSECLAQQKSKRNVEINPHVFDLLKEELGEYELSL